MPSIEEVFLIYRTHFVPAYGDVVALSAKKPSQILVEEANILSHLAQYQNPELSDEVRQDNLTKAYNHILRATLDLHKLIWVFLKDKLETFIIKDSNKRLCFNIPEADVLNQYKQFVLQAQKARRYEIEHIGNDPLNAIAKYDDLNKTGFELYRQIDLEKVSKVQSFLQVVRTKEFLFGIITSLVATAILWLISLLV